MNPISALRAIRDESDQTEIINMAEFALGHADVSVKIGPKGTLVAHLPGVDSIGHHVTIPLTLEGISLLRQILMKRRNETHAKIGSEASPTQAQVNAWLAVNEPVRTPSAKASKEVEKVVKEFDLSELGL